MDQNVFKPDVWLVEFLEADGLWIYFLFLLNLDSNSDSRNMIWIQTLH